MFIPTLDYPFNAKQCWRRRRDYFNALTQAKTGWSIVANRSTAKARPKGQDGATSMTRSRTALTKTTQYPSGTTSRQKTRQHWCFTTERWEPSVQWQCYKSGNSAKPVQVLLHHPCGAHPQSSPTVKTKPPQNIKISTAGLPKLLRKLKAFKTAGPDGTPNTVLKTCAGSIALSLNVIFKRSLDTGRLPADLLEANISAAFKKGDRHEAENYRILLLHYPVGSWNISSAVTSSLISSRITSSQIQTIVPVRETSTKHSW